MSLKRIREESKNNNCESTLKLARCFYTGTGVEKDVKKAFTYFTQAEKQGSIEAKTYLAFCYLKGIGTDKNEKKAVEYYKDAAEKGEAVACYSYGLILKKGLYGAEKNLDIAKQMFEKAASLNNYAAKYEVGLINEAEGKKLAASSDTISKTKGNTLLNKAEMLFKEAADKGFIPAKYSLGIRYLTSTDKEKNKKALALFEDCSKESIPSADYAIAYIYDMVIGVQRDYWKSFEWYKKAFEGGYDKAIFNIIYAYMTGLGVKRNYTKAIELCRDAVNKGVVEANYFAGICFKYGFSVNTNIDKAIELFEYAAEVDYAPACYQLGLINDSYYGYNQDDEKAVEYYTKAYNLGSDDAGAELARINLDKNKQKALEQLRKAADANSIVGCELLANIFEEGKYISQDLTKALDYYQKAADLGSLTAAKAVVRMAKESKQTELVEKYKDKIIIKKDEEAYLDAARACSEAKDYERAAFWYAMCAEYAEDEDIKKRSVVALNKFQKDSNGLWTVTQ